MARNDEEEVTRDDMISPLPSQSQIGTYAPSRVASAMQELHSVPVLSPP